MCVSQWYFTSPLSLLGDELSVLNMLLTLIGIETLVLLVFLSLAYISFSKNILPQGGVSQFILGGASSAISYLVILPFVVLPLVFFESDFSELFTKTIGGSWKMAYFFYYFFIVLTLDIIRFVIQTRYDYYQESRVSKAAFGLGWSVSQSFTIMQMLVFQKFLEQEVGLYHWIAAILSIIIWNVFVTHLIDLSRKNSKFVLYSGLTHYFFLSLFLSALAFPSFLTSSDLPTNLLLLVFLQGILILIQKYGVSYFGEDTENVENETPTTSM